MTVAFIQRQRQRRHFMRSMGLAQSNGGILVALAAFLVGSGIAHAQPGPGGHGRGLPPAAFEVCKGKKADDACEVSFGEHKMVGKCGAMPDGKMVCKMAPPPELLKACEGKKEGDACSATMGEHKVDGTCN